MSGPSQPKRQPLRGERLGAGVAVEGEDGTTGSGLSYASPSTPPRWEIAVLVSFRQRIERLQVSDVVGCNEEIRAGVAAVNSIAMFCRHPCASATDAGAFGRVNLSMSNVPVGEGVESEGLCLARCLSKLPTCANVLPAESTLSMVSQRGHRPAYPCYNNT